ncbi:MAG: hypothetical protein QXO22_04300 [Thermosphaera sp.]
MRVAVLGESPLTPSSMGKVVHLIAAGLTELGYEVSVIVYSAAHLPTPSSFKLVYNQREWACRAGEPLADLMPDVDVEVIPWGEMVDYGVIHNSLKHSPDVLIVYAYPYVALKLNDLAFKYFTSRRKPAVLYALHEGPYLDPALTQSILAYSMVMGPTQFTANQYLEGLASALNAKVEDVQDYFTVVNHPINVDLYTPDAVRELRDFLKLPERVLTHDYVVGMLAKNHVRKDFKALAEAVAEVRKLTGKDVAAGMYWVNSVSANYWSTDKISSSLMRKYGLTQEEITDMILLLPDLWAGMGMTEQGVIYTYSLLMDMHLFLTRGESYGLPPVESTLLGTPTASTDIPPQREALGEGARYVRTAVVENDDYVLWAPQVDDAASAILEFIESKLPTPDRENLVRKHDYRNVAREISRVIEAATLTPNPLSEKIRT